MPLDIQGTLSDYKNKSRGLAASTNAAAQGIANLPQPVGPTAESVNQAAAQRQPTTWAEFTGRGGLQNTAMSTVGKIKSKLEGKRIVSEAASVLAAGEAGADALYRDASAMMGNEVSQYVPQRGLREWGSDKERVSFYDEKGVFLPYRYAQAVAMGVLKWQKDQKDKSDRMQAGSIIGSATSPQSAAAGVLGTGQATEQYKEDIGRIKTPEEIGKQQADIASTQAGTLETEQDIAKKKLENEWYPTNQAAINAEKNSQASKTRMGGSYTEKLSAFNNSKAMLLNQLNNVDKIYSDPITASNPDAVLQAEKKRDQINAAIDKIDAQIAKLETEKYGSEIAVPPKDEASVDATNAARELISGMDRLPPKGMTSTKNELGAPSYQRGKRPPDSAAYNTELANRTSRYLETNGIRNISPDLVLMLLQQNNSLEDILNDIFISSRNIAPAAHQPSNAPAGTLQ